jgi:hypothetical protein
MGYITEGAASGADVSHDHEGGGAMVETLSHVGAGGLFTYGTEVVFTQYALDLVYCGAACGSGANPGRFALYACGWLNLYRNAR